MRIVLLAFAFAATSCSSLPQPTAVKVSGEYTHDGDSRASVEFDYPLPRGYRK